MPESALQAELKPLTLAAFPIGENIASAFGAEFFQFHTILLILEGCCIGAISQFISLQE